MSSESYERRGRGNLGHASRIPNMNTYMHASRIKMIGFLALITSVLISCQTPQRTPEKNELRQQFIEKSLNRTDKLEQCESRIKAEKGLNEEAAETFCKCVVISMANHLSDRGVTLMMKQEYGPGTLEYGQKRLLMEELVSYEGYRMQTCGY